GLAVERVLVGAREGRAADLVGAGGHGGVDDRSRPRQVAHEHDEVVAGRKTGLVGRTRVGRDVLCLDVRRPDAMLLEREEHVVRLSRVGGEGFAGRGTGRLDAEVERRLVGRNRRLADARDGDRVAAARRCATGRVWPAERNEDDECDRSGRDGGQREELHWSLLEWTPYVRRRGGPASR